MDSIGKCGKPESVPSAEGVKGGMERAIPKACVRKWLLPGCLIV